MTRPRISRVGWAVAAALTMFVLGSAARAQDPSSRTTRNDAQLSVQEPPALEAQSRELAESLVARREAALGRTFDPAYRSWLVEAVAARPAETLQELQSAGDGVPLVTNAVGDSAADLVYTPMTPCRIADTRSGGGAIAAGGYRSLVVAGTTGFEAQGGTSGGCGVPLGATSAMINFVAVDPAAAGDLRITPYGTVMPTASILNWAPGVAGLNLANGLAVALCNPAVSTCTYDVTLLADASAIHVVADVQGYFRSFNPVLFKRAVATFQVPGSTTLLASVTATSRVTGTALVTARGYCNMVAGGFVVTSIGTSASDSFTDSVSGWGVLSGLATASQRMYTAQRSYSVTRGTAVTYGLFGTGTAGQNCSVDIVVQGVF